MARRRKTGRPDFQRTDRVGSLIREILAEALARIGDERLEQVSLTGVDVDRELTRARVYFDALDDDDEAAEALDELRGRLRSEIGERSRLRRAPALEFVPDPAVRGGEAVDRILDSLDRPESGPAE